MKKTPQNGFSLTELLVVLVLFGIISSALMTVVFSAQRTWATGSGQAILTAEMRKALDKMSRELVQGKPSQIQAPAANGVWGPSIVFRIPEDRNGDGSVLDANGQISEWSDWITYRAGLVGARTSACLREVQPAAGPAATEVLSTQLSSLSFRRQAATPDLVEIQVTCYTVTEKGQQMQRTAGTQVKLRN